MLTEAWFPLKPHAQQSRLWRTKARFPVVVAGRGSGKTELSRRRLVRYLQVAKAWPNPRYGLGLPTYRQAKYVAWEEISALIPKVWLAKGGVNKSELTFTTIWGSTLHLVGMDKPHRVEGTQFDGFVLDEMSDQKPEGFTRTVLPMLTHRNGWCWRVGKPKRNGCGATAFREAFEVGLTPNTTGIESYNWKSDTVLTPEQLTALAAQMGEDEYNEEINASWLEAKGGIFYAYSDMFNVSDTTTYRPDMCIGVGADFNVDPMAWVLFHVINGKMYVFDEVWLRNTNTQATLDELARRYGFHENGWKFFGCASSVKRQTSASSTDYLQILNDTRFKNKNVTMNKANPSVQDRFAATNALLCNKAGDRRCFIHPRCKNLRSDLQQRTYKVGTRDVDDKGDIGHITDALGYPIYRLFPIRVESNDCGNVKTYNF
jgi:hypothetical protein